MHDHTVRLAGSLVTVDQALEREFEARLVESSTLAFRVAYGVLRHRQDAELEERLRLMSGDARQQFEGELAGLKGPLAQMRQRSQELLAQESALAGQLASEQSRWMDFNSRLDDIEREIRDRK